MTISNELVILVPKAFGALLDPSSNTNELVIDIAGILSSILLANRISYINSHRISWLVMLDIQLKV